MRSQVAIRPSLFQWFKLWPRSTFSRMPLSWETKVNTSLSSAFLPQLVSLYQLPMKKITLMETLNRQPNYPTSPPLKYQALRARSLHMNAWRSITVWLRTLTMNLSHVLKRSSYTSFVKANLQKSKSSWSQRSITKWVGNFQLHHHLLEVRKSQSKSFKTWWTKETTLLAKSGKLNAGIASRSVTIWHSLKYRKSIVHRCKSWIRSYKEMWMKKKQISTIGMQFWPITKL